MTYQYAFYAVNTFIIYAVWAYFILTGISTLYTSYTKTFDETSRSTLHSSRRGDRYLGSHRITRDV